jgi:30S ribosomal protein S31
MGKGDKRSKKGKIVRGSYGKSRPNPSKQKKNEKEKQESKKNA